MRDTGSSGHSGLEDIASRLRGWAIDKALPLWSRNGFDSRRGGFHERLNPDGSPDIRTPRRLRVQARQIYVYAHAASLNWFPDAKHFMLEGVNFMIEHYRSPDRRPGYVSALAADNSIANALRDTYDHMFVLLALTWAAKVSGDSQIRAHLDETLGFVDAHLTAADGSFVEGIPASQPRRQNPHMHAFESMLAIHETVGHPQAIERAKTLLTMMTDKFLDRRTGTIGEYFTDAWVTVPGSDGDIVEPGHLAEWTWLLRKYERLFGIPSGVCATRLLLSAVRWRDPKTGLLIDEVDRNGLVRRASRRVWPQAELAKAWLAESEANVPGAAEQAAAALQRIASQFLDRPCLGGWVERFDDQNKEILDYIPATTFYHLFSAIAEADRLLGNQVPLELPHPVE